MVKKACDWKWSSCKGYYGEKQYPVELLDKELIFGLLSEDKNESVIRFRKYSEEENDDNCLDDDAGKRLSDGEARQEIERVAHGYQLHEIKTLTKQERDKVITQIKEIEGLSQRQAARILGISPNLIFKA